MGHAHVRRLALIQSRMAGRRYLVGIMWDDPGGAEGRDRRERRGLVMVGCGCLLAVVALVLSFASVVAAWIRDAQLLGR